MFVEMLVRRANTFERSGRLRDLRQRLRFARVFDKGHRPQCCSGGISIRHDSWLVVASLMALVGWRRQPQAEHYHVIRGNQKV